MKLAYIDIIVAILLVVVMSGKDENYFLKRLGNGVCRGSREHLWRKMKPEWWVQSRLRRAAERKLERIRKPLEIMEMANAYSLEMDRRERGARKNLFYICSSCGSNGAHVLREDDASRLYYRCVECGGRGVPFGGGISVMFDNDSGERHDVNWEHDPITNEMTDCRVYGKEIGDLREIFGYVDDPQLDGSISGSESVDVGSEGSDSAYVPDDSGGDGDDDSLASLSRSDGDEIGDNSAGGGSRDEEAASIDSTIDTAVTVKFYPHVCDNCHREADCDDDNDDETSHCEKVRLSMVSVTKGAFGRGFATTKYKIAWKAVQALDPERTGNQSLKMLLCEQCKRSLTLDSKKVENKDRWPAMIWSWLTNEKLMRQHGSDLWKLVPGEWRRWWIYAAVECVPLYHNVTLAYPSSIFADVTRRKEEFQSGLATMNAAVMKRVCNEHLFSVVRCPWGCGEYFHKCGTQSMDLVIRKLYGSAVKTLSGSDKYIRDGMINLEGFCPDYCDTDNVPRLLGNKEWKVRPSIAFIDGVPQVLCCRYHRNGSSGKCFYPPRNPNGILSSFVADQVTPTVIRPRNMKQFKAHAYSDTFQMSEMRGQFGGVDTFHLTTTRDFAVGSDILQKNEALAMKGRRDIANLVTEWGSDESRVLPSEFAEAMFRNAEEGAPSDEVIDECIASATYVTLADAVKLYETNKERQGRTLRSKLDGRNVDSYFVPSWPPSFVHVHPRSERGSEFPSLVAFCHDEIDCHLLWSLSAMMIAIPSLWEKTDSLVRNNLDWYGWLLTYVTRVCFPKAEGKKSALFRFKEKLDSDKGLEFLLEKIGMRTPPEKNEENDDDSNGDGNAPGENEADEDDEIYTEPPGQDLEGSDILSMGSVLSAMSSLHGAFSDGEEEDGNDNGSDNGASMMSLEGGCLDNAANDVLSMDIESVNADDMSVDVAEDVSQGYSIMSLDSLDDNDDSDTKLHDDGTFHAEDIMPLLALHSGVMVVPSSDLGDENFDISDETELLVVFNCNGLRELPPADFGGGGSSIMELRFVSGREMLKKGSSEFAYMRHGGKTLTEWWVQRRIGKKCIQDPAINFGLRGGENWHFAVYVREVSTTVDRCRDLMLASMGVAQHVRCREHDLPLVTAPFRASESNRVCCTSPSEKKCSKRLVCCCPVKGCQVALCSNHKGGVYDSSDTILLTAPVSSDGTAVNHGWYGDVFHVEEDAVSCDSDEPLGEQHFDWLGPDPLAEHDISGGEHSETSSVENGIPLTGNIEPPLNIEGDPTSLPGCVILNNVGSLLVRKRSKGKPSLNYRNFMERIVATTPGKSVPLVFPEAMLFPSLFWKDDDGEGSLLGAFPCGALAHSETLRRFGIADLTTQLRSRVTNPALATSTDPRYLCYAFDALVNLGCRHEDTRVVLNRGIIGTKDGIALQEGGTSHFNVDTVDSRPTVNRLAAAVAEKKVSYFFTHTPNASDHFGLAPIREWVCSDEAVEANGGDRSKPGQFGEIRQALRQASGPVLLRNWMETARIYMDYITLSPERPLGKVEHIWWRFEFQDAVGNLPHIHALLWLEEGSETQEVTEGRIRGSNVDLITADEVDELIAEGLLSCREEAMTVKELARRLLDHVCSDRCQRRIGIEDNELRCRVTDNAIESPNCARYCMKELFLQHGEEACKVLKELKLFVEDADSECFRPLEEVLKATKHYPPADPADGKRSACNGRLFVLTRSNQNLKIMTGYLASRYLAKYLALVDENNRVYIGSMSKERNVLKAEKEIMHNTKITGSKENELKREEKRKDRAHPKGRAISHMEMLCVILGYEPVITTQEFVHVPTVPLEERPAFEVTAPIDRLVKQGVIPMIRPDQRAHDLDAGDVIPSYQLRNRHWNAELPLWRTWSDLESLSLRDQCLCSLSLDAITVFGVRPPELRWVRQPRLYYRWFYRATQDRELRTKNFQDRLASLKEVLSPAYDKCAWIDGTDTRVYVRQAAIPEILDYLRSGGSEGKERSHESFYAMDGSVPDFASRRSVEVENEEGGSVQILSRAVERPYGQVFNLFSQIRTWQLTPPRRANFERTDHWEFLQKTFLGPKRSDLKTQVMPVVWFNSVKPSESVRWLVHVLLSMGEYDCEAGLLGSGNMVKNFVRAGLVRSDLAHREEDVRTLTKRYVLEQLVFLPGGTYAFDKHLVQAYRVLKTVLVDEGMPYCEIPAGLYTHVRLSTEKGCEEYLQQAREHLCDVMWFDVNTTGMFDLPFSAEDLKKATLSEPIQWVPSLRRTEVQSEDSFLEQRKVISAAVSAMDLYQNYSTSQPKGVIAAGGPGSGKTSCLQAIGLIARSRGLNVGMSATMCERALQLGGVHFARFCKLPHENVTNPCRIAELAIASLMRSAKETEYIRSLDVLLIDELGNVSAEMISALDIIFRRVRNNSAFFGGILVFGSMDAFQLRPVNGRPPLLSPQVPVCLDFLPLNHSVRAAHCPALQRLVQICRLDRVQLTDAIREEFINLIQEKCTFVSDWDDPRLKPDMLRMFATHAARIEAEELLMEAAAERFGTLGLTRSVAIDQEASLEGNWVRAGPIASKLLTKKAKQPAELIFFPRARYEISYNKPGHYAQSQLAVLADVPTREQVRSFEPVRVYVAPFGTKAVSENLVNEEDFLRAGYQIRFVGRAPSRVHYLGSGFQGKREQYGLRPRVAATIHAGMGQDLPAVISKVDGDEKYLLFQRELVVVLLSRTHYAKDIYFVGDPYDTAVNLWNALQQRSRFDAYLEYLMKQLTDETSQGTYRDVIDIPNHYPLRPIDHGLPDNSSGFSYLLTSIQKHYFGKATYIGQCANLNKRYKEHRDGTATRQTADPEMRPWVLLAYVSGFEGCSKSARQQFESLWQGARDTEMGRLGRPLTAEEVANVGERLVKERKYADYIELQHKRLLFHRCGSITNHPSDPTEIP